MRRDQMDNEKVNLIIKQYYQAKDHLMQGELRIALVLLDNSIEKSLKIYLNIKIHKDFPILIDLLQKKNGNLLTKSEIDEFKKYHIIRNKYYHEMINEKLSQHEIDQMDLKTCRLISILFNRWIEDLTIEINENVLFILEFRNILKKIEQEIILFYYTITSIYDPEKDPLNEGLLILKDEDIITEEQIKTFKKATSLNMELKGKIEDVKEVKNYTGELLKIYNYFIKKREKFYEIANHYYKTYNQDRY